MKFSSSTLSALAFALLSASGSRAVPHAASATGAGLGNPTNCAAPSTVTVHDVQTVFVTAGGNQAVTTDSVNKAATTDRGKKSTTTETVTLTVHRASITTAPSSNKGQDNTGKTGNTTKKSSNEGKSSVDISSTVTIASQTVTATTGKKSTTTTTVTVTVHRASITAASASQTATATTSASNPGATDDPQTSLTLDKRSIMTSQASDGNPSEGQTASLTSTNNFMNFCLTQNVPITNGQQVKTGSCNPVPMGRILATNKLPSSVFIFPTNFGTIPARTSFTIKMKIKNLKTGNFVNAKSDYYSAPAQVDGSGTLIGHSHCVIEPLESFDQTKPTDPTTFSFFKGLNNVAENGLLTADVTQGLPAGKYRIGSINAAANHQPALASVAQHGTLDAWAYFTVV